MHFALQVFCDEAGVPVTALPEEDISVHEQALDSQMRAFFRLTSFSHRYHVATKSPQPAVQKHRILVHQTCHAGRRHPIKIYLNILADIMTCRL
jgi:hypothetical protein